MIEATFSFFFEVDKKGEACSAGRAFPFHSFFIINFSSSKKETISFGPYIFLSPFSNREIELCVLPTIIMGLGLFYLVLSLLLNILYPSLRYLFFSLSFIYFHFFCIDSHEAG